MTNEWPLSFFNVRENSVIYLESIQNEVTPLTALFNKQLSSKSKYFKTLGLLPTLGTIMESKNEDKLSILRKGKDTTLSKRDQGESFSTNDIMEVLQTVNIT